MAAQGTSQNKDTRKGPSKGASHGANRSVKPNSRISPSPKSGTTTK